MRLSEEKLKQTIRTRSPPCGTKFLRVDGRGKADRNPTPSSQNEEILCPSSPVLALDQRLAALIASTGNPAEPGIGFFR
ncbi:MAG: hypothetical protein R3F11_17910 [Verrucomicrobiales bacterium]